MFDDESLGREGSHGPLDLTGCHGEEEPAPVPRGRMGDPDVLDVDVGLP
jgi:hypothetical protein